MTSHREAPQPALSPCSKELAISRARILLGCYRKGDCEDPEVYYSAVVAQFMRYPGQSVVAVTDPVAGLPSRQKFLPTVAEVAEALEAVTPRQRHAGRASAEYQPGGWAQLAPPLPDSQETRDKAIADWEAQREAVRLAGRAAEASRVCGLAADEPARPVLTAEQVREQAERDLAFLKTIPLPPLSDAILRTMRAEGQAMDRLAKAIEEA